MFEDYEDCYVEPSEAEAIIRDAKEKLNDLLTEEIKQTIESAREAKRDLEQLQEEIRSAQYRLGNLKLEHEREEKKWQELDQYRMPKKYIQKLVEAVAGDFAPDDTVYAIKIKYTSEDCPLCHGAQTVECTVADRPGSISISCPTCHGSGKISKWKYHVEKCTVSAVYLKLCFHSDHVSYWNTECVFLDNHDTSYDIKTIFHTQEEAEKALAEINAKEEQA